jgi:hypothetical protein
MAPFFVPQSLVCIFKYIQSCRDASVRTKILSDLLDLLDSNPVNVESLMVLSNTISVIRNQFYIAYKMFLSGVWLELLA